MDGKQNILNRMYYQLCINIQAYCIKDIQSQTEQQMDPQYTRGLQLQPKIYHEQTLQQMDINHLSIYGPQNVQTINHLDIFIHGMYKLGIEIGRNLINSSVRSITFCGVGVGVKDSQMVLTELALLAIERKSKTKITIMPEFQQTKIFHKVSRNYNCFILLDNYDLNFIKKINLLCCQNQIKFIYGGCLGLYCFIFNDFGPRHTISDPTGQKIHINNIDSLSKPFTKDTNPHILTIHLNQYYRAQNNIFSPGDRIRVTQVLGMSQINNKQYTVKTVKNKYNIEIEEKQLEKFDEYIGGGIVTEVRVPIEVENKILEESLEEFWGQNGENFGVGVQNEGAWEQMHVVLNGVWGFYGRYGRLMNNCDFGDVEKLREICSQFQQKNKNRLTHQQNLHKIFQPLSLFAHTQIHPVYSFWSGIIAQEALKTIGMFTPINQWLHYNFFHLVPEKRIQQLKKQKKIFIQNFNTMKDVSQAQEKNSYAIIFGDQFVKRMMNIKLAVISNRQKGRQLARMMAIMGFGSHEEGVVYWIDDQKMGKEEKVANEWKEVLQKMKKINKNCNFESITLQLDRKSQTQTNHKIWSISQLILLFSTKQKIENYLDQISITYQKPLIHIGIKDTKGSKMSIIPFKTCTLGQVHAENSQFLYYDYSTVKNFPFLIEHTIQMAKFYYESFFEDISQKMGRFVEDRKKFLQQEKQKLMKYSKSASDIEQELQTIQQVYEIACQKSYHKCLTLAIKTFYQNFHNRQKRTLKAFPPQYKHESTSKPFWSGVKKIPIPLHLDLEDDLHLKFIQATANLYAIMAGVKENGDLGAVRETVKGILGNSRNVEEEFNIYNEEQQQQMISLQKRSEDEYQKLQKQRIKRAIEHMYQLPVKNCQKIQTLQLRNSDPSQWDLQFIYAASNLRARNYSIKEQQNYKIKIEAFQIIPKLPTTISVAVGLLGIDLIKYILNTTLPPTSQIEPTSYNFNLALPFFVSCPQPQPILTTDKAFDPIMCGPIKAIPSNFTKWSKISLKGPSTLLQLKQHIEKDYKIQVCMICSGSHCLYNSWSRNGGTMLEMDVKQVMEKIGKQKIPEWKKFIGLYFSGATLEEGVDYVMPNIDYYL